MIDVAGELVLRPRRGAPEGVVIPAGELVERFSRSSGPGGQSVNTADSRVTLRFDVAGSTAFTDDQRARVLIALARRLTGGVLSITATEHRSQHQNRIAARGRLANLLGDALEPPAPPRRATRPTPGSRQRRLDAKKQRAQVKQLRGPVVD